MLFWLFSIFWDPVLYSHIATCWFITSLSICQFGRNVNLQLFHEFDHIRIIEILLHLSIRIKSRSKHVKHAEKNIYIYISFQSCQIVLDHRKHEGWKNSICNDITTFESPDHKKYERKKFSFIKFTLINPILP